MYGVDPNLAAKFYRYYKSYLGITSEFENVFACEQRTKPINFDFFQFLITTQINERLIFSIAPAFYQEFSKLIELNLFETMDDELINALHTFFYCKFSNYSIRTMYRLTVDLPREFQVGDARALTINDKELFINTGKKSREYKEEQWNIRKEIIENGRFFVVIKNDKIISWAEVSNICFNGGNLVVMTLPEYRNSGYGRMVVAKAVNWCAENNILPIYWVDSSNISSIKLASSLGFNLMNKELVVSI